MSRRSVSSWLGLGLGPIWVSLGIPQGMENDWDLVA